MRESCGWLEGLGEDLRSGLEDEVGCPTVGQTLANDCCDRAGNTDLGHYLLPQACWTSGRAYMDPPGT